MGAVYDVDRISNYGKTIHDDLKSNVHGWIPIQGMREIYDVLKKYQKLSNVSKISSREIKCYLKIHLFCFHAFFWQLYGQ